MLIINYDVNAFYINPQNEFNLEAASIIWNIKKGLQNYIQLDLFPLNTEAHDSVSIKQPSQIQYKVVYANTKHHSTFYIQKIQDNKITLLHSADIFIETENDKIISRQRHSLLQ
ncbi:MAG: hypothetical protein IJ440_04230 [Alphaproteobacteria bacterium]|nr:hypothetical protein [Alphaproteobacteria bacterium]